MVAIKTSVPVGLPGTIMQFGSGANLNTGTFDADAMPAAFGLPVKLVAGLVSAIEEDDTADVFWGILVASDVQPPATDFNDFGFPPPDPLQLATVMLAGYALVKCTIGTPVKGGAVYMRIAADTGKAVGDLEATYVEDENVLIPQLVWNVNGKDPTTSSTEVIVRK